MIKPAGLTNDEKLPEEPMEALEGLMNEYGTYVLRTAFFYTGDRGMAEDISQEVFLRAYRNWSSFRGHSSVKTWLTRIAINLCKDKLGVRMFAEQPIEPGRIRLTEAVSAEEAAMRKLRRTEILQSVMKLPDAFQEIIFLYYYQELSTAEIASAIGVAEGTARSRLHRAREMLGRELREEGHQHD
ncbi:sigma-70 family RNA polymerase sigma factor [Paenibacillus sp. HB172176]|uniref:sigma-70 family RNA polymerase sigma factor n=1 Tax=Paenibacillus sp. HB172176 TaxID=2493690 RepID=UPI00143B298E|nr:sigma-70 family RNA polymerase sigma factor [Paenibacillus sp. HB172176]